MKIFRRRKNTHKKTSSILSFRLNLLFFIIFLLFAVLIAQLAYLQIVYGGKFQAEVDRTDQSVIKAPVPRGLIYDSKGRVIVSNKAENAVTYTKSSDVNPKQMYNVANDLSKMITVDTADLTPRQEADYYLTNTKNYQKIYKKLPRNQKMSGKEQLENSVVYDNMVKAVQKKGIELTPQQKNSAMIFSKMSSSYQLSTTLIKNSGLSTNEIAKVSEHLSQLPGVGLGTDWNRSYPEGEDIKDIVGNVSTEKQGLPQDQITELLAKGYSRNDRVGTSYLEKSYESILSGSKRETQVEVNSKNSVTDSKEVYKGSAGDNINLTIDSKFQQAVEKILKNTYASAQASGYTQYSDGAYVVAMNPKTGEILAMAGINRNTQTGETNSDALGVINRTFVVGSAVKSATVLGALMDGVITPSNNYLPDEPVYLPATPVKKSIYPIGTFSGMNAAQALEVSSNNYMMKLAMLEGHAKYVPNKYISMNPDIFTKMRGYFNQFGLGVKTGIDLPGEASGIEGPTLNDDGAVKVGSALDLAYGNYDAYTPIQVVQYMATIANGGYRVQPHIVKSISSNVDGKQKTIYSATPKVLNKVGSTTDEIGVVKQGMYQVTHGSGAWTTASSLKGLNPSVSGKTGTAESFFYDPKNPDNTNPPSTLTSSFVGYAPSDDPEIVINVVFPNLTNDKGHFNTIAAKQIFEEYFKENEMK